MSMKHGRDAADDQSIQNRKQPKTRPGRPRKPLDQKAKPKTIDKKSKRSTTFAALSDMEGLVKQRQLCASSANVTNDLAALERSISEMDQKISECKGVEHILRAKVLTKQKAELIRKRDELVAQQAGKSEKDKEMFEYMAMMDRIEKATSSSSNGPVTSSSSGKGHKVMPMSSYLCPTKTTQKNLLETMSTREADKWQNLRAHKKRYAVLYERDHPKARVNYIDTCPECQIDLVVDRELATSVCPSCGWTRQFASHIFETKETERDDNANKQQSLNHMQKFSSQFERGHASSTPEVLEALSTAYSHIHIHDPSKVQSCRTSTLMKGLRDLPKATRRIPDRLTKELKGEGIPEFSGAQIQQLLSQRNRLRVPDDMVADALAADALAADAADSNQVAGHTDKKSKKSFNNQIFMRQLGRSSHMEPARLFPNPKTTRIHIERTRALENECLALGVIPTGVIPTDGHPPTPLKQSTWALYPAS